MREGRVAGGWRRRKRAATAPAGRRRTRAALAGGDTRRDGVKGLARHELGRGVLARIPATPCRYGRT